MEEEYTGVINADLEHNEHNQFCADASCACHEDADAIEQTNEFVQEGLMSVGDADRYYRGGII